jgi:uncharacterized protein YjbJ (UPF0337 family)
VNPAACLRRRYSATLPGPQRSPRIGSSIYRRMIMDNDRVEGSMKNIKGSIKEGVGKAVGDSKMEAEGKMDKAEGKIQNTVGGIKDSLRKDRE